ncbi:N-6 DNA methylase [Streptosporangium sp. NPDC048865]|uniref:N-6 DNA methylase n=1 Tax=Streptosporangium sp. NPDC048865 TaxID=3155766 RepID=UPI003448A34E
MTSVDAADVDDTQTQAILTELFGPLAVRVCGRGRPIAYLTLLFSLVFLRHSDRAGWAHVREEVREALDEQRAPKQLLRAIAHHVDEAMRKANVPPNLTASLDGLEAEAVDDVAHIVRLCEELGADAFHPLVDRFESWSKPDDEQFFTPRPVVRLVVDLLLKDAPVAARVHDPYLGTGEFLMGAIEVAEGFQLSGASPSPHMLGLASMRLLTLNVPKVDLSVTPRPHRGGSSSSQADYIMSNPPFNSRRGGHNEDQDGSWIYGPPPPHNDNYAWLQHILMSLAPEGQAAVLMPNRAAVSTDARELHIRKMMIENGAVRFIIALPRQLFAGTAAPAMLWGLGRPARRLRRVLLIDARRTGVKNGKQRVLTSHERDAMVECLRRWESGDEDFPKAMGDHGTAVAVSAAEIAQRAYSLAPSDYLTEASPLLNHEAGVRIPRPADAMEAQAAAVRLADERVRHIDIARRTRTRHVHDNGWRDVRLADLCHIQTGPSHSLIKKAERAVEGVPLVAPAHLREHRISAEASDRLSHKSARALEKYQMRQGDILVVRTGSVGPTALVTAAETGWLLATNLMRLRPFDGVDSRYLLALLSSPTVQKWIEARSESASAIPSISSGTLGTLPVRLPPPDEQHRIGLVVDAFDTQITAHRILAKAAENTRAALADDLVNGLLTVGHPSKETS